MKTNGKAEIGRLGLRLSLAALLSLALVAPVQAGRVGQNFGGSGSPMVGNTGGGSAAHGDLEMEQEVLRSNYFDGQWIDEALAQSIAGKKRYLSHQACPQLDDGTNCLAISVGEEDDYQTWTILDNTCNKKKAGKRKQFKSSCWKGYEAILLGEVEIASWEARDGYNADQTRYVAVSQTDYFLPAKQSMKYSHTSELEWTRTVTTKSSGFSYLSDEVIVESFWDADGDAIIDEENPLCIGGERDEKWGTFADEGWCAYMEIYRRPTSYYGDSSGSTKSSDVCFDTYADQTEQLDLSVEQSIRDFEDSQTPAGLSWLLDISGSIFSELFSDRLVESFAKSTKAKAAKQKVEHEKEFNKCMNDAIDECVGEGDACDCSQAFDTELVYMGGSGGYFEDDTWQQKCEEAKTLSGQGAGGAGQTEGDGSQAGFNPGGSCSADWECAGYVNAICVDGTCVVDGGAPL